MLDAKKKRIEMQRQWRRGAPLEPIWRERESLVAYIFGAEAVLNKKRALLEKP